MLATQVTAPKRIRTAEPESAAPQPSKEEYHRIALYHFDRGDRQRAFDFFRLAGYDNNHIENAIFNHLKNKGYERKHIESVMEQELGHMPSYKWQSDIPEAQRGQKREGSDGYLSARALLKIGRKIIEVNAVIEEPKFFPEIIVNKPIPFDNLPVPPGRYQLLAKFESPEYGLLKARCPAAGSGAEFFTIASNERKAVQFVFSVPGVTSGGSRKGKGEPININVDARAEATAISHGGGGGGGQPQNRQLAAITGRVVNPEGQPIPHAHVSIDDVSGFESETDGNGEYYIPNIPAIRVPYPTGRPVDRYILTARASYYDDAGHVHTAQKQEAVSAGAGEETKCDFLLEIPTQMITNVSPWGLGHTHLEERYGPAGNSGQPPKWFPKGLVKSPVGSIYNYSQKAGKTTGIIMSLVMIVLGIVIAAITGIWQFVVGLACLGGFIAMPMPSAWEREYGTMWKGGNAWKTGQAAAKLTFKVACIFFIGWALWDFSKTSFPFAALIFIGFAFVSYFSLPGSYNPEYPYEVMGGMIRFFIGFIVIPFMIFNGIFQSFPLALISLAFFAVVPTPTKTKNLAQIMGVGLAGTLTTAEMLDKIIFIGIMIWGLAVTTGTILIPLPMFQAWAGQWGLTGDSLYVFYAIWFISAIGGFFSPPETRPYTGILMLATALVLFGLGPGSQTLGGALFGEWWPSIHNTVIDAMKPFGEMFGQIQSTFGQSWLLLSCPTCYARQITEGNFVGDDISKAGAFGLEIDKFQVQSIYPEEPFTIQINLANKGTFKARNIRLDIVTTIDNIELEYNKVPLIPVQRQIDINTPESFFGKTMTFTSGYGRIFVYTINFGNMEIERQDVKDLFIVGKLPCPVNDRELSETREKYIPFVANLTYTYDSESTLQIDFISEEEWKRLSVDNKLVRGQVPSKISSAPAKLSLGTADQPIKENNPFNLGFNISSAEGPNSHIDYAQVWLTLSSEFGGAERCQGAQLVGTEGTYNVLHFDLGTPSKASFCFYPDGLKDIKVPKKTYTLSANASYVFNKWDEKDTLINFRDVCWAKYLLANPNNASQ